MPACVKRWNAEITFLCPTWNEACLHRVFKQGNKTCPQMWFQRTVETLSGLCVVSSASSVRPALMWTADAWLWERGHLLPGSRPSQPGTQLSLHMILLEPRLCLCIITPLNVTLLIKISVLVWPILFGLDKSLYHLINAIRWGWWWGALGCRESTKWFQNHR